MDSSFEQTFCFNHLKWTFQCISLQFADLTHTSLIIQPKRIQRIDCYVASEQAAFSIWRAIGRFIYLTVLKANTSLSKWKVINFYLK